MTDVNFDPVLSFNSKTVNYVSRIVNSDGIAEYNNFTPGAIIMSVFTGLIFDIMSTLKTIAFSKDGGTKGRASNQCFPHIRIPSTIRGKYLTLYLSVKTFSTVNTPTFAIQGKIVSFDHISPIGFTTGFIFVSNVSNGVFGWDTVNVYKKEDGGNTYSHYVKGLSYIIKYSGSRTTGDAFITVTKYRVTDAPFFPGTPPITYSVSSRRTLMEAMVHEVLEDTWMNKIRKRQVAAMIITNATDGEKILATKALPDEVYVNYETRKYIQTDIKEKTKITTLENPQLYSINGQEIYIKP